MIDWDTQKQLLRNAFTDQSGWETQRLLQYVDHATDFYYDSMTQIKLNQYHKGRVCLLGDAAYAPSPTSGQGSSMALNGAYVLYRSEGDYEMAFAEYQRKLWPCVEANQAIGVLGADSMIETSELKICIRNFFIKRPVLIRGMYKKIQMQIQQAANDLMIEDY